MTTGLPTDADRASKYGLPDPDPGSGFALQKKMHGIDTFHGVQSVQPYIRDENKGLNNVTTRGRVTQAWQNPLGGGIGSLIQFGGSSNITPAPVAIGSQQGG
jgi:hypothetical protein